MSGLSVLHVVGDGAAGGGTTVVLALLEGLLEAGARVRVATQLGSYLADEAARRGVGVLGLDFRRRSNSLRLTRDLAAAVEAGTIIHAHGARAGLPCALIPRSRSAALVYTVHGFHYLNKTGLARELARQAERFCIRRASATVFVSEHDRATGQTERLLLPSSRHEVIYNGAMPGPGARNGNGQPEYDIAFLGRLHRQKNPLILPDILKACRPLRPSLRVIGGGEMEDELRRRAYEGGVADQMLFLGAQDHGSAISHLARARVMLLPSLWEGLPVSVIEAMHLGLPVVASRVPGTDELVVHGSTGLLVDRDDAAGYAAALNRLLSDHALRASMGEAGQQRAREMLDVAAQVRRHLALYESLLSEPRRHSFRAEAA